MKSNSTSTLASVLWNTVAVFGVIVAAGVLGVAIAGAFAYHQLSHDTDAARAHQARTHVEPSASPRASSALPPPVQPLQNGTANRDDDDDQTGTRPVAAEPSDQARFTYADYHIDVSRIPMATFVRGRVSDILPPPLAPSDAPPGNAFADERHMASLSDPGSHYIIDSRTGRVVGIDGTAGAADEARRQPPPAPFAASARLKPVLAALPVDEPAYGNLPPPKPDLYMPVRRAMPLIEISHGQPFDAAAEVADDPRPVMRAEPVIIAPAAKPARRVIPFP